MRQWMLRITAYADRLVEDLDLLDWPESIKKMQRDWVGRAIQQSLVAELSRLPIVTPISAKPEVGVIDDVEESVRAAKGAG